MKKSCVPFFLLLAFAFWNCSDKDVAGISSVETGNACVIKVVDENAEPVVNAVARLRPANYLAAFSDGALADSSLVFELVTDSAGYIHIDSLIADSMTLEILDGYRGVFATLSSEDMQPGDSTELAVARLGKLRGRVKMPQDMEFAWVEIYGTDRKVKTDSEGNYEIDSLAPAAYGVHVVVGDSTFNEIVLVKSAEITEEKVVTLIDFESGITSHLDVKHEFVGFMDKMDSDVVTVPSIDNPIEGVEEAGAGREGHAFHWTSSKAKGGSWSFFEVEFCPYDASCDLSALDSVEFYIRGTGTFSLNLESLGNANYQGKAMHLDSLDSPNEWIRKSIKPSDFDKPDSCWGNFGWDIVRTKMTSLSFFVMDNAEIWLDDVKLYGIRRDDLR